MNKNPLNALVGDSHSSKRIFYEFSFKNTQIHIKGDSMNLKICTLLCSKSEMVIVHVMRKKKKKKTGMKYEHKWKPTNKTMNKTMDKRTGAN